MTRTRAIHAYTTWPAGFDPWQAKPDPEVADALDALYRRPLTAGAEDSTRRALARRDDDHLAQLLVVLHADNRLVVPDGPGSDPIRIVCTMGATRG